jgi:lipoprotein-releasing system permease protein
MGLTLEIALSHLRHRRRQSIVSMLGVALGVGFFIAIAALMQGFQNYFVETIIDVSPHVVIKDEYRHPPKQPVEVAYPEAAIALHGLKPKDEPRGIRNGSIVAKALGGAPGVIAAAPTLEGQIFLTYGSREVSANLIGIEPERERLITHFEKDLVSGRLEDLVTTANGLILGSGVAERLGASQGDTLTATSPAGVVLKVKLVGIVSTGVTTIDQTVAYALLKKAQILAARTDVVNRIRLKVEDVEAAEALAQRIERRYGYRTESWQEANQNVLGIFIIQNGIMYSTTGAILVVAAFGIFNIISTVVLEKVRDIAILKSMGLQEGDIRRIFLTQGLIIGATGALLGWGVGFGLTEVLGSIRFDVEGFVRTQGFPLLRSPAPYLIAGAVGLFAAIAAAYLPARRAARLDPVATIRGAV